jgi:RNA polymerase sigma-70 factor, ECF subfamily
MLRISRATSPSKPVTFRLEGELLGAWVEELDRTSAEVLASGDRLSLDLAAVTFVGRAGAELLRRLGQGGAVLGNPSPFVKEQLESWGRVEARRTVAVSGGVLEPGGETGLIARLRRGDTLALDILMDRHAGQVYRVAYGITRSEGDAEEVVQDVFLALFRKVESFEGRAALASWLYRVATNAALIKRRGKRYQVEVKLEDLEDLLPQFREDGHRDGDRTWLLADWSQAPDDELISEETRAVVQQAIDALPDHYRAIVLLRDIEGLSNEEVAAILGESVASVKSRLHRARMALRELLTSHYASVRAS